MQLSEAQKTAVETIEGQVMLVSCPGSGKTSTVVRRVAYMVDKGIPAQQILVLTFSKAAADEMEARYKKIAKPDSGNPWFSTIHSFCYRVIAPVYHYTYESILKETDAWMIIRKGIEALKKARVLKFEIRDYAEFTSSCLNEISLINNNGVDWNCYKAMSCPTEEFRMIYDYYGEQKKLMGKIDYDDMLMICLSLFQNSPQTLEQYRDRFRYLIVDEYQDTNFMQRDILYLLAGDPSVANLCVVGDDDQSIYKFRGARPEIMLDFEKSFPFCKKIYMDVNYRSEPEIIQAASKLIGNNMVRFKKDIKPYKTGKGTVVLESRKDVMEEAHVLVSTIQEMGKDHRYEDMAVLYRKNRQASMLSMLLLAKEIPFHSNIPIESPYRHWIFSDLLSFYKLANGTGSRHDYIQVINKPNRFIPFQVFNGGLDEKNVLQAVRALQTEEWKKERMEDAVSLFYSFVDILKGTDLLSMIHTIRNAGRYDTYLNEYAKYRNIDPDELFGTLESYVNDIQRNSISSMEEWQAFAAACNEKIDKVNKESKNKGVTLSTMHRAKGLEWDCVFIIGANDKIIPSPRCSKPEEIEEERRVFYVAITRAKEYLNISWTQKNDEEDERTRFLFEMAGKSAAEAIPDSAFKKLKRNTKVIHPKYGKGFVVTCTGNSLLVNFDKERTLISLKGKETLELTEIAAIK